MIETILDEKNKDKELTTTDFKIYYRAMTI